MKLRSRTRPEPFNEDAFLWDTPTKGSDGAGLAATEAEAVGLDLFKSIGLLASLDLEDPNERLASYLGRDDLLEPMHALQAPRQVRSDQLKRNVFALEPDGGRVLIETNPKDAPALARIEIENGRWPVLLARLMGLIRAIPCVTVKTLEPFPMTETLDQTQMGNRYFRLITNTDPVCLHDVACLIAWVEPDGEPKRVELLAWPIEKIPVAGAGTP